MCRGIAHHTDATNVGIEAACDADDSNRAMTDVRTTMLCKMVRSCMRQNNSFLECMFGDCWSDDECTEQCIGSIFDALRVAGVATAKFHVSLNPSKRLHACFCTCPHAHTCHRSTCTCHLSTCTCQCPHAHAMCPYLHTSAWPRVRIRMPHIYVRLHAMCPHAHAMCPHAHAHAYRVPSRPQPYREPSRPQQRMRSCVCMRSRSDLACTGRWA